MNRLLMIAYHFPPHQGSSGIQRTLRLVRNLPEFGWEPIVLTAHPRAYEKCSDDLTSEVPPQVPVIRAAAWDSARHLSVAGRYPGMFTRPDRWISWWPAAVWRGLGAIRRYRPAAIWSTYPIPTAHKIGRSLALRSGLPWIADFRDPMAQPNYPRDPVLWRAFERIERQTVAAARLCVFTTPSAVATYQQRYPSHRDRMMLLENGYDEEAFANAAAAGSLHPGKRTLLHSGTVYPSERDPTALFEALGRLKREDPAAAERLVVRFRAPTHDALLRSLSERHNLGGCIEILPPADYATALAEMMSAEGLLVLQAANCNEQIPAKLYEYFRARRPIIALTDPRGDTAVTLVNAGVDTIAPLDHADSIRDLLRRFLQQADALPLPSAESVYAASRRRRAAHLAPMLDRLVQTSHNR